MSERRDDKPRFPGYTSPNYTPVPDVLFDEQLPDLSGAELKVLLYIMRRTFGFKKEADNISLSQITNGIVTAEGTVLDRGTGLSKDSVARAVKGLEEKGIVFRTRRRSDRKGDEPTTYALNIGPVSDFRTPPGGKIGHPLGAKSDTQETVRQETEDNHSKLRMAPPNVDNFGPSEAGERTASGRQRTGISAIGEVLATGRVAETVVGWQRRGEQGAGKTGPPMIGAGVDGNARPRRRGSRRPAYDEDREVLLAFVQDFAREFHDRAPLPASVSRAHNLLVRSGLPRDAFVQRLYQARSITKERSASIRSQAGTDGLGLPTKTKMAYFFAVLEDLLGLKADPDGPTGIR